MSTIRCVYWGAAPDFPATDQHPDAVRYGPIVVDGASYFVDAVGGEPGADAIRTVIEPAGPIPSITRRQIRLWLLQHGETAADVEAAIASIANPIAREAALIEWQDGVAYHHDHPLFAELAPLLGIAVSDLPAAFRAAAQL